MLPQDKRFEGYPHGDSSSGYTEGQLYNSMITNLPPFGTLKTVVCLAVVWTKNRTASKIVMPNKMRYLYRATTRITINTNTIPSHCQNAGLEEKYVLLHSAEILCPTMIRI